MVKSHFWPATKMLVKSSWFVVQNASTNWLNPSKVPWTPQLEPILAGSGASGRAIVPQLVQEIPTGGGHLPLWKMMEFVSWDDFSIPNMMGKIWKFIKQCLKPPTSPKCVSEIELGTSTRTLETFNDHGDFFKTDRGISRWSLRGYNRVRNGISRITSAV